MATAATMVMSGPDWTEHNIGAPPTNESRAAGHWRERYDPRDLCDRCNGRFPSGSRQHIFLARNHQGLGNC